MNGFETALVHRRSGVAVLFLASAAATIYLCVSMSRGMPMPGGWTMSMTWMRMPGQSWLGAAASFITMWVLMMVAMMLPCLVFMLSSYRRSLDVADEIRWGGLAAMAGAGYFFVWTLIGIAVYPIGVLVVMAEMRWPALARSVPVASGLAVLIAGLVQFTRWKGRQLALCRETPCCAGSVVPNARSAWRHGLHLGVHCSRCCAGFIAVLLVIGVMNLLVMAIVAAAINLERLAPRPDLAARVAGVAVVAAGAIVIAFS